MKTIVNERIIFSFLNNCIRGVLILFIGVLISRNLGPFDFGRFAFLTSSFIAISTLINLNTTGAYFTFASKKKRTTNFIYLFWIWVLFQILVINFLWLVLPSKILYMIWPNENTTTILLAFFAVFFQHSIWVITSQLAEASRKTYYSQSINTIIVIIHLLIIILLIKYYTLSIELIFIFSIFEWLFVSVYTIFLYDKINTKFRINYKYLYLYFFKFYKFCMPLILFTILSSIFLFLDRWIIQFWGGPKIQAFFAISLQVSSFLLIGATAIVKIFWKESSVLIYKKKNKYLSILYSRIIRNLYIIILSASSILFLWSEEILFILYGKEYVMATSILSLIIFYPIFQSINQINGIIFFTSEKTKIFSIIGIAITFLSLIFTLIIFNPAFEIFNNNQLESLGIKILFFGIIEVMITNIIISNFLNKKNEIIFFIISAIIILTINITLKNLMSYFFENIYFIIFFQISLFLSFFLLTIKKNLSYIYLNNNLFRKYYKSIFKIS
jgi:O-antigen/teichoic acid export membrane protein